MATPDYESDNPVAHLDKLKLGRKECVNALRDVITTVDPPFTLGIYGPWGSGKTSLMLCLKEAVEGLNKGRGDRPYHTLFFRPWKYRTSEGVWRGMITLMFQEFRRIEGFWTARGGGQGVKRGATAMLNVLGSVTGAGKVGDAIARTGALDPEFRNAFEDQFRYLLDEYIGPDERLVVFIDDLDRCLPETAVALLEALKLYCDESRCVFVIGIDNWVVQHGIEIRYGKQLAMNGRDYLRKMIQVAFVIPDPDEDELATFVDAQVPEFVAGGDARVVSRMVCSAMGGNPRQIKRFFNTLRLTHALATAASTEVAPAVLAKVLVLQLQWPDFYDHLRYNPKVIALGKGKLIEHLTATENQMWLPHHKHIRLDEFLCETGPSLEGVDENELRRYFRYVQRTEVAQRPPDATELRESERDPAMRRLAHIMSQLEDSNPRVRANAATELGDSRIPLAVHRLMRALRDPDDRVRTSVARALGHTGDTEAVPFLVELLLSDDSTRALSAAAQALGEIRAPQAVPALSTLLERRSTAVCLEAVRALSSIGDEDARDALVSVLDHQEPEIRGAAMAHFAESGDALQSLLLSEALDGVSPWIDPSVTITNGRARRAQMELGLPMATVRRTYETLAKRFGGKLKLEWEP